MAGQVSPSFVSSDDEGHALQVMHVSMPHEQTFAVLHPALR